MSDAEVKIARDESGFFQKDTSIDKFLDKFLEYSQANLSPATLNRYRAVIDHLAEAVDKLNITKLQFMGN